MQRENEMMQKHLVGLDKQLVNSDSVKLHAEANLYLCYQDCRSLNKEYKMDLIRVLGALTIVTRDFTLPILLKFHCNYSAFICNQNIKFHSKHYFLMT